MSNSPGLIGGVIASVVLIGAGASWVAGMWSPSPPSSSSSHSSSSNYSNPSPTIVDQKTLTPEEKINATLAYPTIVNGGVNGGRRTRRKKSKKRRKSTKRANPSV